MPRARKIMACDCETDPFTHGAEIVPFIWGLYNGKDYWEFLTTEEFVQFVKYQRIILYAHNGGKFDFMFLLPYITTTKVQVINGRIVSMMLGDCELRDSFSAVPVSMKEIQKDEIDYWKMHRDHRDKHMEEIRVYLKSDCVYLYDLMTEYRKTAGVQKTIASNALAFAKKQGINIGRTPHTFDRQFRKFFYGGRTECFRQGQHSNINILDIRSAYPFAMQHEHATGSEFHRSTSIDDLSREELQRSFIRVECMSHGALPMRTKDGLTFPHEYNEYCVTGWEYVAALELGIIENVKIISVRFTKETIHFRDYVNHWFEYKKAHNKKTQPIQYTIGKIMMNSLYGKTAQNPASYFDYKIVPAGTFVDTENGWMLYTENPVHEIHRRESLWKYKDKYGDLWERQKIYHNVATGASITGFTRSMLLRAIHTIGLSHVIYCDTDSIICDEQSDISLLPQDNILGNWELEDKASPVGYFAGKKLYGIQLSTGKNKIACKGSKLMYEQLQELCGGAVVEWRSETPTFSLDGSYSYLHRSIQRTGNGAKRSKKSHGEEKIKHFSYSVYDKK